MHIVEYRICLPFTVEEESEKGEGVEVVKYEPCEDPVHGVGHYTEKRLHLYNKLPTWMQSFIPNIFYIEEKSWNYFPITITEYTCSFLPKFHIKVETKYENNSGQTENSLNLSPEELSQRTVEYIDIVTDPLAEHKYKESEDPKKVCIKKTDPPRGPLKEGWQTHSKEQNMPTMCAYKIVKAKFEVWGLQTRVEAFTQKTIRDILLLAHRQAFCWTDEWYDMTYENIVKFERETYAKTNEKVLINSANNGATHNLDSNNNSHDNQKTTGSRTIECKTVEDFS